MLVDAQVDNVFNSLNHSSALLNARVLCPSLAPALINICHNHAELYVAGSQSFLKKERPRVTARAYIAMSIYTLAVTPLTCAVSTPCAEQVWFADDATAG